MEDLPTAGDVVVIFWLGLHVVGSVSWEVSSSV